jgi:hypothetical protein
MKLSVAPEERWCRSASNGFITDPWLPAPGGPGIKALTPEQRRMDHQARLTISRELGHEREQVSAIYLGK